MGWTGGERREGERKEGSQSHPSKRILDPPLVMLLVHANDRQNVITLHTALLAANVL